MKKSSKFNLKEIINYSEQSIDKNDIKDVTKVLLSKSISQGPSTIKFENKLKNFFGAKYCSH